MKPFLQKVRLATKEPHFFQEIINFRNIDDTFSLNPASSNPQKLSLFRFWALWNHLGSWGCNRAARIRSTSALLPQTRLRPICCYGTFWYHAQESKRHTHCSWNLQLQLHNWSEQTDARMSKRAELMINPVHQRLHLPLFLASQLAVEWFLVQGRLCENLSLLFCINSLTWW